MEKFIKFLEENNAWDKFEKAFTKADRNPEEYVEDVKRLRLRNAISGAFAWTETDEGHKYWRDLSDKWKEKSKTLKERLIEEYNKL